MNTSSYTSASVFPLKLFDPAIIQSIKGGYIPPVHLQLNPTNRCNLKCKFCSCANKDDHEMSYDQAKDILERFKLLGTKAITLTGGGEPLCHPSINAIIAYCNMLALEVGLVSNGVLLDSLDDSLDIRWCRISLSGSNTLSKKIYNKIKSMPHVDWAFSYVLKAHDYSNITNCITLANDLNVTHIRIVDDILSEEESKIGHAREIIEAHGIDTSRVIWQGRKTYTAGTKSCLISLLKPSIDAHGNVYPCCGCQYASVNPSLNFSKEFNMGYDYESLYLYQANFDGSACHRCFYSDYNNLLNAIKDSKSIEHRLFV